jgi:hypothetical protein
MAIKIEMTQQQLVTLAASVGICTILGLERTAPPSFALCSESEEG